MIPYEIKKEHFHSEFIDGFKYQLDFLRRYGYSGNKIIGEIFSGVNIFPNGIGSVGFEIDRGRVTIGPPDKQLYVISDNRNNGLGKKLVELVLGYISHIELAEDIELKIAELTTGANNEAVKKIVEHFGFTLDREKSCDNFCYYFKEL